MFNTAVAVFQSILSFIHDLTSFGGTEPNKEINAFCFHAGLRLPYPYHISIAFSMCENGVLDEIIDKAKDFYYSFAWARDKNDICRLFYNFYEQVLRYADCIIVQRNILLMLYFGTISHTCIFQRAFENIKQWTLQTLAHRCQWDEILQLNLPQTDKQYNRRAVEIALQTMQTLRSQSCSSKCCNSWRHRATQKSTFVYDVIHCGFCSLTCFLIGSFVRQGQLPKVTDHAGLVTHSTGDTVTVGRMQIELTQLPNICFIVILQYSGIVQYNQARKLWTKFHQ